MVSAVNAPGQPGVFAHLVLSQPEGQEAFRGELGDALASGSGGARRSRRPGVGPQQGGGGLDLMASLSDCAGLGVHPSGGRLSCRLQTPCRPWAPSPAVQGCRRRERGRGPWRPGPHCGAERAEGAHPTGSAPRSCDGPVWRVGALLACRKPRCWSVRFPVKQGNSRFSGEQEWYGH